MSKELTVQKPEPISIYSTTELFESGQRMAKALAESDIVPKAYQKSIPNTMVALEMANRLGMSPIEVMQNLNVIGGTPSWKSTYVIARINGSGYFKERLDLELSGEGDSRGCIARAVAKNGKVKESPCVTVKMAKDEGWYNRTGSKWRTMTDLMLQYRAAALFARLHCPELLAGFYTAEEVQDINPIVIVPESDPLSLLKSKMTADIQEAVYATESTDGDDHGI